MDPELLAVFDGVNRTELYQTCRRNGLAVPPGLSREHYIAWLTGELERPSGLGSLDSWRWGLIGFIDQYWMRLRPQLTCPAKDLKDVPNPNPTPCFGCSDMQVIACVAKSGSNEQYIRDIIRRRNESTDR